MHSDHSFALLVRLFSALAAILLACGCNPPGTKEIPADDLAVKAIAASGETMEPAPPAAISPVLMDTPQREFLWEVEHHGNVLVEHGFKPWGQCLANDDAASLRSLLPTGFQGIVPAEADAEEINHPRFRLRRLERTAGGEQLDADGFVDWLMQFRAVFNQTPQVSFSLMSLCPTVRDDLDSVWRGSCLIRLSSPPAAKSPCQVVLEMDYTVARPDPSSYGPGGWLLSCTIRQSQTGTAPRPLFREVAAERGIKGEFLADRWQQAATKHGHEPGGGVYVCDYNRDGRWDLLITEQGNFRLYEGEAKGQFKNVTLKTRLIEQHGQRPVVPAAFVDLDGDGWEDLILGGWVYRNEEGRSFSNVTGRTQLRISPAATGISVADYDHDGHIDLYVSVRGQGPTNSWLEGESGPEARNQLWRNTGDWRFVDVTEHARASGGRRSTFSSVWLDANNDTWSDLYVINEFGNGVMLCNQTNGKFREQLLADGPEDYGSMGLTAGDIDNDGDVDIYVAGMYSKAGNRVIGNVLPDTYAPDIMKQLQTLTTGSQLHRNLGQGQFEQVGRELQVANVGWAYGPALVDLDNDGFLDVHALAGFQSMDRAKPDG